jgi:hypothetical protein
MVPITLAKGSKDFNYAKLQLPGTHRIPGAFRIVEAMGLRKPGRAQEINLFEHSAICYGNKSAPEPWIELKKTRLNKI